jgi:dihydroxyacetone kinase-like predicted kinase
LNLPCQANHTIQGNDLAGKLFTPGVYCSATGVFTFSAASIRLDARGDPNAKFIFRTETTLTTSTATSIELLNSAKASNVFWAIGTSATLGTSSNFLGTIIAGEAVTVGTSTVVDGRALALTAVTFSDQGVINFPQ